MTITQTGRRVALVGLLALIAAVLPFTGASAISGTEALQLSADSNVATSIANSQVVYTPVDGTPDNPPTEALIGRADLFADNLASGALQGAALANGRPLLLNDETDGVNADVLAELDRLLGGTGTVHILGGEAAQGQGVADALEAAGYTVNRFEGATRTETAIAIATATGADTALLVRNAAAPDSTDETQAYADALGGGALAASNGYSVLFTQTDVLTQSTADYLASEDGPSNVIIVGGTAAVSEDVETAVGEIEGITVTRAAGATRFDTAVELNGLRDADTLGGFAIAVEGQADAWADGFSMANLSGLGNYPLVLTNNGEVPQATADYLASIDEDAAFANHFANAKILCGASVGDACQALADSFDPPLTVVPFPGEVVTPGDNTGIVVDTDGATTYTFVAEGADGPTIVVPDLTDDDFTVDGQAASSGIFFDAVTVCDIVTVTEGGAADGTNDLHELENADCDDITSGVVGDVTPGTDFWIIEPVTGTQLSGPWDSVTNVVHFVDGVASSIGTFDDDVNEGDTVEILEDDPAPGSTTIRLTNEIVSGTAGDVTNGAGISTFTVGGLGDDFFGGDVFEATNPAFPGTEVYMVDGEEVEFDGCAMDEVCFNDVLSDGDDVTYARQGDEETFTIGNVVPPTVEGLGADVAGTTALGAAADGGTVEYLPTGVDTPTTTFTYTAGAAFLVDGLLVDEATFEDDYSEGDAVSYRPADDATGQTERVTLTNMDLSGPISTDPATFSDDGDATNDVVTIDRDSNDGDAPVFADYAIGTADGELEDAAVPAYRYFVDGVETDSAGFNDALVDIDLADGPSLDVVEGTLALEFRLTTAAA